MGKWTYKKAVIDRKPIGPGQALILGLVEREGQFRYWMVNYLKDMGYSGSNSYGKVAKRLFKSGYLDNNGRLTDKGRRVLEVLRSRGRFDCFVEAVVNGEEDFWEFWEGIVGV